MTAIPALTLRDVAAELGRSTDWLKHHWRGEVRAGRLPAPIHERGGLVWSAPVLHAFLVRDQPPEIQAAAAAYRAALSAALAPPDDDVEAWRHKLAAEMSEELAEA